MRAKISNGANDRPIDETIAQTGAGLPDDSSKPVDVSDAEIERVRKKLTADQMHTPGMPYDVDHAQGKARKEE
ncbi:hypothetical protein [Devosia rhizoryzae]|uniref:Uncharacterized protein n=1 Tax=Devosia rhizoryzae TaxID=2774137 RepID=A0ABX7CC72_9HYPH|nr:hypothetical protein [Devosia rhizoryzae]QQR41297.1 hypothetical protein JI748_05155 [Devosia rhizoryzae]